MDISGAIGPLFVIGIVGYLFYRGRKRDAGVTAQNERQRELETWARKECLRAENPETPLVDLKQTISDPIPHDDTFYYRLAVLRAAVRNPSLPVELQAAVINRISQEESSARLDKHLKEIAKNTPNGFVMMTWEAD